MFDMLAINGYDVAQTKSTILQKSLKCRDIDTVSSLELFNRMSYCYNTWTGCLQLVLGRKFPLNHNRVVIARIVCFDDRYTLRNSVFRHFQRKMNNKSEHAEKIPNMPCIQRQVLTESLRRFKSYQGCFHITQIVSLCENFEAVQSVELTLSVIA
ncbi:hypothetical protein AVEN_212505-1 [Araneus ventricosus]|uniref:Uncharacterized protein n=1 Tax=Araneus ventricosus TaxID=182803 RepID=A0A4Y2JPG0_ARAVE|nr:hypothetical protein AVEN_97940-1 [Araneus ventricosus]GBM92319.1 hypothetical protein AVEN_212505-1 [Araneus ventricosus]